MHDKIRVASLYRSLRTGGDERRLMYFSKGFDRSRFEHVLFVVFPPDPADRALEGPILSEFLATGVEVIYLEEKPGRWVRPWLRPELAGAALHIVERLVRELREREIDVLDARLAGSVPLAVLAGKLARTKVIVSAQYNLYTIDTRRRRALMQLVWPQLDALVCDSQLRLDEMVAALRFPPRGVVIDNGIFPPESDRPVEDIRRELDLPLSSGIRIIGQVATLLRFKGYSVLLEAAALVLEQEPDTAFLFCGFPREDGYREELLARAKELGIADRVRITGYDGSIGDVWKVIDIHAHASLYDSAPQTIVESMSLGKPAVVTSAGGIPEMIEPGKSALMVEPNRADLMAEALIRLLRDPEEAKRLGEGARRRYEERYRAETMVRSIEALYEELLSRA
ncbi:MAG: glycosyltransferase family 4 protein [Byssovorax sp.]